MKFFGYLDNLLRPEKLTHGRMAVALMAAIVADGLQWLMQAFPLAAQLIDVAAMVVVTVAIGFHVLFLPSFVLELVPVLNAFPTWTGCVIAVIALRRREASLPPVDEGRVK